jgi:signal recognition particle subunit SRP54
MTGQETVNIARSFNERVGLTGLILTKIDGDARQRGHLHARSDRRAHQVPGHGREIDGFELFHPDRLADRILGMGDVMTLIERPRSFDEQEALKLQRKLLKDRFTLQDFLEQLQKIRKMGSLTQLLGMIPGMSRLQSQIDQEEVEQRIKRWRPLSAR